MAMQNRLQHIGIIVSDAEAAAAWYQEKMGFVYEAAFATWDVKVVFVHAPDDGTTLELIQKLQTAGEQPPVSGYVDHVAYACDNIENAFAEAKADGLEILEGITDIPEFWDNGVRFFMVKAAGGEKIEFCKVLP